MLLEALCTVAIRYWITQFFIIYSLYQRVMVLSSTGMLCSDFLLQTLCRIKSKQEIVTRAAVQ